jgi:hypothetical protein
VQIHGEDRVELTILLDESDYRLTTAELRRSQRWQGLVLLLPMLIGAFVSIAVEQLIGALSIAATLFLLSVVGIVNRRRRLTMLPDWAYGPVTYRVWGLGIEVESAVARRTWRWLAVSGWRKSPTAYWFTIPGSAGITLPRRMLTTADEAALEHVLSRFGTGKGTAVPQLPPPEPTIRAASPGSGDSP